MSLLLPYPTSEIRAMFDFSDLVNWGRLPKFRDALQASIDFLGRVPGERSVNALCLRADGRVWLIRVGRRNGWRKVWDFGNPIPQKH